VAEVAGQLGRPFQPWQRFVADVALEVHPKTGRLAYREVVLICGRQMGKTLGTLAVMVHRAHGFPAPQQIIYTSATRLAAVQKVQDEHLPILRASPYGPLCTERKRTGQEALLWANGSKQSIAAPTKEIGHSQSVDLAVLDEAWSHEDDTCEQGLSPTMITRQSPQMWVPSAVGKDRSQWLRGKVEAGRQHCEDPDTTTCYIEFSAPEGADYQDPDVWWDCLPGLGHVTTEDAIRHELRSMEPAAFCRAYLSQWPNEMVALEWRTISEADWTALHDEQSQITGRCALGMAVTPDRSWGSIAVAGKSTRGGQHWQLLDHRPMTGWMVGRLRELRDQLRPCAIVVDPGGPAGSLVPDLLAARIDVVTTTVRDVCQATGAVLDAVKPENRGIRHCGELDWALNQAVAAVLLRPLGDAQTWSRRGVISPLEACTLAGWGHTTRGHLAVAQVIAINGTG